MKTILIAGGTGFLGKNLAKRYNTIGYEVVILSRSKNKTEDNIIYEKWDGKTKGNWSKWIDKATILINLTGKSVDCRYNEANKKEILNSRIDATKVLGELISKSKTPPPLWINASTATIYRHSEDRVMTEEDGEIGDDFSMNIAKSWEKEFYSHQTPKTRTIQCSWSYLGTNHVLGV